MFELLLDCLFLAGIIALIVGAFMIDAGFGVMMTGATVSILTALSQRKGK